ncbi:TadE/TadG family type IV pilus assembly protein [Streptomyces sp. SL13]|uniref:TadE/TadG family type IV pilus assembly protein n=1 Tax=Streptantibioticus silvisoli TaxID=2705255 RepID=A0AA90H4M2_9ACTN|nr:TadE/TadG family type IV pilus assembly protein [Streptantibioticus silvisoli]MDI5974028.1 TadE/TadG family type IV pilus assembly protein [Streptantibioticus silvisoli]
MKTSSSGRRWWPRHRLPDTGAAATEIVIATPLLLLLLLLIVQFALAWHAQHIAQTAASHALAAARAQGGDAAAGRERGTSTLRLLGRTVLLHPRLTVVRSARSAVVEVQGGVEQLVPGLHLTVAARAAGAVERWSVPGEG